MSEDFNYLSSINNVKIISYTSQANSCQASNILNSENSVYFYNYRVFG